MNGGRAPRQRIIDAGREASLAWENHAYPGVARTDAISHAAAAEALRLAQETIIRQHTFEVDRPKRNRDRERGLDDAARLVSDLLSSLLGPQGEEQKEDHGAALLPADPSASVKTETLPNKEDYYWSCEEVRAVLRLAERAHKDWRWALDQLDAVPASATVIAGEASRPTEQERSAKALYTKDFSLSDHERDTP